MRTKRQFLQVWRKGDGSFKRKLYMTTTLIPANGNSHLDNDTIAQEKMVSRLEVLYPILIATIFLIILMICAIIITRIFFRKQQRKESNKEHPQFNMIKKPLIKYKRTSVEDFNSVSTMEIDTNLTPLMCPNQCSTTFSCYGLGVIEPSLYKNQDEDYNENELEWPEGHLGRLWFSLRYEPSTEKLFVALLKARNLPSQSMGSNNTCDPFVRLQLMPDDRRFLVSKQKRRTCNPYFDETLVFQISAKDLREHILKLTLIDGGRPKRQMELGYVTFPLDQLEIGDGSEQQLFKMDLEKEIREYRPHLGELHIGLVYNENLGRLSVSIIEARGLKFALIAKFKVSTQMMFEQ